MAVGHSILIMTYYVLSADNLIDLGSNYFDELHCQRLHGNLIRRLEKLGYKVTPRGPGSSGVATFGNFGLSSMVDQ